MCGCVICSSLRLHQDTLGKKGSIPMTWMPRFTRAVSPIGLLALGFIVTSLGGLARRAEAQCNPIWNLATPAARYAHSMAFDSNRGVAVIFGGTDGNARYNETWEWNGNTRQLKSISGPGARDSMSMAYDSLRNVTVLFGGYNGSIVPLGDTWEWNGSTWLQRPIAGPPARYGHAMAYDSFRNRVVLFGGFDGSVRRNDTWEYDGTSWVQVNVTGPNARRFHAMTYDSIRRRIVLLGGDDGAFDGETWEYNGTSWALVANNAPSPIQNTVLAFDAESQVTVFFGGYNGNYNGETWNWNGTSWTPKSASGPAPRALHAAAYDSIRDRVVLYGGQKLNGNDGELWEWNNNNSTWTLRTSSGPAPRYWSAMTFDSARQSVVLFGGEDAIGIFGDTWELDSANWTQRQVSGPTPRYWHAMAYDSQRAVTVLFGGNTGGRNAETWEWNGTAWVQRIVSGPTGRDGHAMAYDAARQRVVLFGGRDVNNQLKGDTWEWDGTTWSLRSSTGPSARYWHGMAYDSNRQRVFLFGGLDASQLKNDIWEWNGTIWSQRTAGGGPSARTGFALGYDAGRGKGVLFGGYDGINRGDTWDLDLSTVSPQWAATIPEGAGPPARARPASAYAANRSSAVIFGGTLTGSGQFADTWQYGAAGSFPSITTSPQSQARCLSQSVTFSVVASGVGLSYQWRKGGNNIGGATSPSYTINSVTAADGGDYDCRVTNACGGVNSAIATLTISSAPSISQHPSNLTRCVGQAAAFSVTASGANLTYQWKKGANNISGATSATLNIASVVAGDAGSYSCVVNSDCGNTTSNAATLTVNSAPSISQQPQDVSVCSGQPALFSVTVSGGGTVTYQWRKGGNAILNANSSTYEILSTVTGDAGSYDCVVTGSCGATNSNPATLVVNSPIQITQQPTAASRCVGGTVTFTVAATGTAPITYQWRKAGGNIGGATGTTLTLNTLTLGDAGNYDCLITNACGNVATNTVALAVSDGPTISQHPTGATVCPGGSVQLTVNASGDAPITYQWRKDTNDIPSATAATFNINSATAGDAGSYTCRITNPCGNRTSNAAVVVVNPGAPNITQQPTNVQACLGSQPSFTVAATGTGSLAYQWRKGGVNIGGANSATYTINFVTSGSVGSYDCVVTDQCGSSTSNSALLSIGGNPPQITQQPASLSSCPGQSVTFTIAATGTGVLTYQWRKAGVDINGATSPSLNISPVNAGSAGNYDCIVMDNCASSTSNTAVLTVGTGGPTITQQPSNVSACLSSSAQFTVAATGSGTLTYQWRKGGSNIGGATGPTFTIPSVTANSAGNYDCVITDNCGNVTSNVATLTIASGGPTISAHPQTGYGCIGGTKVLSVTASGSGPLSYRWRKGATLLVGETASTLTLTNLSSQDNGQYTALVSNNCGTTTSNPATLTVTVLGDADCDGALTNFDIDPFVLHLIFGQAAWEAIYHCDFLCANDIDRNGAVTNFDIDPFVNLLVQ